MVKRPKIFIISGPSRVGKDAITQGLLRRRSLNLRKVITATTRPKRPGEVNGRHYYFLTADEFQRKIDQGGFLEWAVLRGGRLFGTPVAEFDRILTHGKNVILNIDVQGAKQLTRARDDIVKIFIKPDSLVNLKRRMKAAGFPAAETRARLVDLQREIREMKRYDHVVVNREGELTAAINQVAAIIRSEINKSTN